MARRLGCVCGHAVRKSALFRELCFLILGSIEQISPFCLFDLYFIDVQLFVFKSHCNALYHKADIYGYIIPYVLLTDSGLSLFAEDNSDEIEEDSRYYSR